MLGVLCRFLCTSSALERLLDCLRSFRVNRLDAVNTRLANMGRCLTTGNFNKPKVNFTKEARKKRQGLKKQLGVAEKSKKARVAVSGSRTKKHQRKMAHRVRMMDKMQEEEEKEQQEQAQEPKGDVKMGKAPRTKSKKSKGPRAPALEAMQE